MWLLRRIADCIIGFTAEATRYYCVVLPLAPGRQLQQLDDDADARAFGFIAPAVTEPAAPRG